MNAAPALRVRRRAQGAALGVAGAEVVCRPSGGLWLAADAALVIADMHLEKGSHYAERGQMLPPFDTNDALARLEAEIEALAPALVIFLGDALHDGAEERLPRRSLERVRALAARTRFIWIAGNHDAGGPRGLPGVSVARLSLASLDFVHEPSAHCARAEVAGHLHPCAKVQGRAARVRRRCFVSDGERIVLPAFGAYAGGLNVRDAAFRPLFRRPPIVGVLGDGAVHFVAWDRLRAD